MTTCEQTHSAENVVQIKASLFTLSIVSLFSHNIEKITHALTDKIAQLPSFFEYAPIVLDITYLSTSQKEISFAELINALRDIKLLPVGVTGGNDFLNHQAKKAHLAILKGKKNTDQEPEQTQKSDTPNKENPSKSQTLVINTPVRSGQQIYATDGDLIVTAPVSKGAEIIADGNIHVYDSMRGKALAGVNGDTQAQIFCHKLEAEMVSIAGIYQLNGDANSLHHNNVRISLENEQLCMNSF